MQKFKSKLKDLENTRRYRLTLKGVITNIYSHQQERSKLRGFVLWYSLKELQEWCICNPRFIELYHERVKKPTRRNKPSIDRIDCMKWYERGNIQVMSSKENMEKGCTEKILLRGKQVIQYDLEWKEIKRFNSIKEACKETWCLQSWISLCVLGRRKRTNGFIRKYADPIMGKQRKQHNLY